jgi:hypothetical protein
MEKIKKIYFYDLGKCAPMHGGCCYKEYDKDVPCKTGSCPHDVNMHSQLSIGETCPKCLEIMQPINGCKPSIEHTMQTQINPLPMICFSVVAVVLFLILYGKM